MCDCSEAGRRPGIRPWKERRRKAEGRELGVDSQRDSMSEGSQAAAGHRRSARLGACDALVLGSQVWGLREEGGRGGHCYLPQMRVLQEGRRVTTSDYLLNPQECLLFALFFVPLVFNGLLYGHMCGN